MKRMKYFVSFSLSLFILSSNVYAVTSYEACGYYSNSSPFQGYIERLAVTTNASLSYPETVTPNSTVTISIENMGIDCSSIYNLSGIQVPSCPQTIDNMTGLGNIKFGTLFASRDDPFFDGSMSEMGSQSSLFYSSLATQNFTAPSTLGTQAINGVCSVDRRNHSFDRTYQVVATVCSDSINNDGQQGADTLDPECHTDCNVNNAGSYTPNHNSETTPPNGTCPTPPTLELNARAAFFQVVKNFIAFITTKAFAGE